MTVEERFAAMEERLKALEKENQALRSSCKPRPSMKVAKTPDEIRAKVAELDPLEHMRIKAFALDVHRYGYDQASIMHGRALPKRGRRAVAR
jgi:predicted exporter